MFKTTNKYFLIALLLTLPAQSALADGTDLTKSFSVGKGGTLVVVLGQGDIRIHTWNKSEIFVTTKGIDDDENSATMTQTGNSVRLEFPANTGLDILDVQVPSQINLDLRTSSGEITVSGSIAGTLKTFTSGGDIKISDVAGDADLFTSGGSISIGNVKGTLKLQTSGGDLDIGDVGKSLNAKTAGGDITCGDVGGEAELFTSGGDVKVGKVSGKATIKTAGGSIDVHGGTGIVTAKTSGGDLRLFNISGSIDAKTSGGNVEASLTPTGIGKSTLNSSNGNIKLYLPETAKATVQAHIALQSNNSNSWNWNWGKSKNKSDSDADEKAENDKSYQEELKRYQIEQKKYEDNKKTFEKQYQADMKKYEEQMKVYAKKITEWAKEYEQKLSSGDVTPPTPVPPVPPVPTVPPVPPVPPFSFKFEWPSGKSQDKSSYNIHSDFKADESAPNTKSKDIRATYTLGGGGEVIMLETTNGNIEIRKMRSGMPADASTKYPRTTLAKFIFNLISEKGLKAFTANAEQVLLENGYDISNDAKLNAAGYDLLGKEKVDWAIEVFKLNARLFPDVPNVYDSLGEAYMIHGNKDLAIQNYKKVLELSPNDRNATKMLRKLQKE